jgi:hypothetical protein
MALPNTANWPNRNLVETFYSFECGTFHRKTLELMHRGSTSYGGLWGLVTQWHAAPSLCLLTVPSRLVLSTGQCFLRWDLERKPRLCKTAILRTRSFEIPQAYLFSFGKTQVGLICFFLVVVCSINSIIITFEYAASSAVCGNDLPRSADSVLVCGLALHLRWLSPRIISLYVRHKVDSP